MPGRQSSGMRHMQYGPNSIWLVSTRLDTFDFVERVETSVSSESNRAVPTWRTTNKL